MKRRVAMLTVSLLMLSALVVGCGKATTPATQTAPVPANAQKAAPAQPAAPKAPDYPTKAITVMIGYAAGSTTDIAARAVFEFVEKELGQKLVVVNKPGAAGVPALAELAAAKPDGYTIGATASVNTVKMQGHFDKDHHDYDIISIPTLGIAVVAVPGKSQFKTAKDLVEYAKANPGKVRMSTTAKGAILWMQSKLFETAAGIQLQLVENPGGAGIVAQQLAGNQVEVGVASISTFKGQADAGNIRYIGMMTAERVPGYENVPTLREQGYDAVYQSGPQVLAPKGLPKPVYDRLTEAFAKGAASQGFKAWTDKNSRIPTPKLVGVEAVKWLDEDAKVQRKLLELIGALKN